MLLNLICYDVHAGCQLTANGRDEAANNQLITRDRDEDMYLKLTVFL